MYAILDIETTGGKYNEESIIEIAIIRYNGERVTERFESLVKPQRPIQRYVQKLTGINHAMVRNAPRFTDIADKVVRITDNCTLVAHNTEFDYRMLRTEFTRLGIVYEREAIDTIHLAEKAWPGLESYGLGKLTPRLGIEINNRHRAMGDAEATLEIFKLAVG